MEEELRVHTLQWHITHRCNLRCSHCYQKDYEAFSDFAGLMTVLEQYSRFLAANGLRGHVNLTGGEPLTSPHLFPLCRELAKRDMSFAILTNGTLIDRDKALDIASLGPRYVQVSIDGDLRTHDRIRSEGSWLAAFDGIDRLREQGVPVLVSFTAQKSNCRQLPRVAKACREHDVNLLWWDRVVTDNEADRKRLALNQRQFEYLLRQSGRLYEKHRTGDGKSMIGCGRALQFLACPESGGYVCNAGRGLLAVTAEGNLMPCRRLPFILGNVFEKEMTDLVRDSDRIDRLRSPALPTGCNGCPHGEKCGGGSRCVTCGQTGDAFRRDVNCPIKLT